MISPPSLLATSSASLLFPAPVGPEMTMTVPLFLFFSAGGGEAVAMATLFAEWEDVDSLWCEHRTGQLLQMARRVVPSCGLISQHMIDSKEHLAKMQGRIHKRTEFSVSDSNTDCLGREGKRRAYLVGGRRRRRAAPLAQPSPPGNEGRRVEGSDWGSRLGDIGLGCHGGTLAASQPSKTDPTTRTPGAHSRARVAAPKGSRAHRGRRPPPL